MPSPDTDSFASDDEEVRLAVKRLALRVLARMEYMFDRGDPQTQMQIARGVMPSLIKSLGNKGENEELNSMKMQLQEMFTEMRGVVGTPIQAVNEIDEDQPNVLPIR